MAQVRWLPARAAAGAVAAAALVLLVRVSRAGSVPSLTLPTARPTVDITGGINPTDAPVPPRINPADADRVADLLRVLLTIGAIIVLAVAAYALLLVVSMAIDLVGQRRRREPALPDVSVEPLPAVPERLRGPSAQERRERLTHGDVRNAVVACWLDLEESAASAGLARQDSQTPADYVGDVLARWEVDPAALTELAELYREARFSTHPMTDAHRDRALAALDRIHADLEMADRHTSAVPVAGTPGGPG